MSLPAAAVLVPARSYAYGYVWMRSDLYVVEGLI